jgi:deoxycytidylate deaminase
MKNRFFQAARKASFKSTHRQHKIGCVLVYKNKIVSVGFNQLKTHPESTHPYKSIHAEFDAIYKSNSLALSDCDLYVYREDKKGKPAIAKPCKYCDLLIKQVGIKNVYYTSSF